MVSSNRPMGCYAPDFELPGIDGSVHHLRQYLSQFRAVGVVFLSYDCDRVLPTLSHLTAIQSEFSSQGVTLMAIDSDPGPASCERREAMLRFAHEHHLNFPYLRDETQDVAETFGATHSPQVFLVNQHGMISYSGSIWGSGEDSYTERAFLREAIVALLDGAPPSVMTTPAQGCCLKWRIQ